MSDIGLQLFGCKRCFDVLRVGYSSDKPAGCECGGALELILDVEINIADPKELMGGGIKSLIETNVKTNRAEQFFKPRHDGESYLDLPDDFDVSDSFGTTI